MASQKICNIRTAIASANTDLSELEELCLGLSRSNALLVERAQVLEKQNKELEESSRGHSSRIASLQKTIEMLEDDRRQLTRVSSIVNLEKQNQALKKEIEQLHEKINRLLGQPPSRPETLPVQEGTMAQEEIQAPPAPTDLFEKNIQGTPYFVDDDAYVYSKNSDGKAGKRIGRLSKSNGKLSIIPM